MSVIKDSYDLFIEEMYNCVDLIDVQEIKDKKLLIMGTIRLVPLKTMIKSAIARNDRFEFVYVGKESQRDMFIEDWGEKVHYITWDNDYNMDMVKTILESVNINELAGVLLVDDDPINIRNVNIMEIYNEIKGIVSHQFDVYALKWPTDELYRFNSAEKYLLGVSIYKEMNSFFSM